MPKFKIITSEVFYSVFEIEAENEDAAIDKIWQGEENPKPVLTEYENWQIDSVQEIK